MSTPQRLVEVMHCTDMQIQSNIIFLFKLGGIATATVIFTWLGCMRLST